MSSQIAVNQKENAEIYHGEEICKAKSQQLLADFSLPKGLLPLDDLTEVGHNKSTGFVWLKQRNKKEHKFRKITKTVSYDTEVTAFVEDRRMRRLTGVKSKELLIWVSISDIFIPRQDDAKITFANSTGISRSFPVSAFDLE